MKVIITGATGFVGRALAKRLYSNGVEVLATGRSISIGEELARENIPFKSGDISYSDHLNKVFTPADCVIHCAGKSGDWGKYQEFYQANVVGTQKVIQACQRHGIHKIIYISTPALYYDGNARLDILESNPLPKTQCTSYGKTKLQAEEALWRFVENGGRVVMFRPRALYGPHDATIIPRILRMAENGRMPLINGGKALVDLTYIGNFLDVVEHTITAPDSAWNQVYNISNGDPMTVRDWFSQVLEIFGIPFEPKNVPMGAAKTMAGLMELIGLLPLSDFKPTMTRFSVGYLGKSLTMNIDKARNNLGYNPKVNTREGFELFAQWVRSGQS